MSAEAEHPHVIRGRVALGAHVRGAAALWIWRRIEGELHTGIEYFVRKGYPDGAQELARAAGELRTVGEAWLADRASARGSAEAVTAEAQRPSMSDRSPSPVTAGWAADRLGITPSRIRQLLRSGELEGSRTNGRWVIEPAAVEALRTLREMTAA